MPTISVQCPSCGVRGPVDESRIGRKIRCRCGGEFVVSRPAPLDVSCPSCGAKGRLDSSFLGKSLKCKCGASFLVDAGGSALGGSAPGGRASAGGGGAAEWQPGQVILDLYEVKGLLGQGGMGRVYRVHHRGWNTELAAKQALPHVFARHGGAESFIAECETWVNLGLHPHTVSCYYVRPVDGVPVVFAELVEGGSLKEWIDDGRLYAGGPEDALKRVLDVAIQFAWGLQHAHEQGLIHQDVKPANVMVTADGIAKVTDFGVARARAAVEAMSEAAGGGTVMAGYGGRTPAYCSPEQAEAAAQAEAGVPPEQWPALTRRTDLWSWAVSLFEMLAGEPPTGVGQAAGHTFEAMLDEPDEWRVQPPEGVVALLRRCFRHDPEARPRDMAEAAEALAAEYAKAAGAEYPREAPKAAEALADTLNNRAVSLYDLGKHEDAEKAWEEALQAHPHHLESTYNLGLARWRAARGTDTELILALRRGGELGAPAGRVGCLAAAVMLESDDCEGAVAALEGLSEADRGLPEAQALLAAARARTPSSRRCVRTFEGHTGKVNSVCLSVDGAYALSGSEDQTLRLWDMRTGQCVRTFQGHTEGVTSACLSADGAYALSGSDDFRGRSNGTVKLWEVGTGRCLRTFEVSSTYAVCLSADGRHAVSGSNQTLRLWDVQSGKCLRTIEGFRFEDSSSNPDGHMHSVLSVCLSADARYALSGSQDRTLKLWDLSTGKCVRTFKGHTSRVRSACLTADGRLALSASEDGTVRLWKVATGECLRIFQGHTGGVTSVCLSADGRHALSASQDTTLRLWDVATAKCVHTFQGHADEPLSVRLSGDGACALSGSADKTLKAWVLAGNSPFRAPVELSRPLTSSMATAADADFRRLLDTGRRALADGDAISAARVFREARLQTGFERHPEILAEHTRLGRYLRRAGLQAAWQAAIFEGHTDGVTSVCLSADGSCALSGSEDRTLRSWDVGTGRCMRTCQGHRAVNSVCLSPDGRRALAAGQFWAPAHQDGGVTVWDVTTGKSVHDLTWHTAPETTVCLSPDGSYALSGGRHGYLALWDVSTGRLLRTFGAHGGAVTSVCMLADGAYAISGGADGMVRLWHVARGECLRTLEGHAEMVLSVHVSADGTQALSGSYDQTLKLWDVATGRCLRTFEGHTEGVTSVCLSTDGAYALSGSGDSTMKLWEVATGDCLRVFEGCEGAVTSVCLSTDGAYALSGSADKMVRVWFLDWALKDRQVEDWDEGAHAHLQTFLTLHTPYVATLPPDRDPSVEEITLALTRRGRPAWTKDDFQQFLYTLGCAGYGWLRPEGVRRELERMAASWDGPPPLITG